MELFGFQQFDDFAHVLGSDFHRRQASDTRYVRDAAFRNAGLAPAVEGREADSKEFCKLRKAPDCFDCQIKWGFSVHANKLGKT